MEMNIHEHVWVQLTEDGEDTYQDYWNKYSRLSPPITPDALGWYEFELWELMLIFGKNCAMHIPLQFRKNILRFSTPYY
jgi:hypothetical protein